MARNERFDNGDHIRVVVPAGVDSGEPVAVGDLVGVALTTRDADGECVIDTRGVYDLVVTGAITLGASVYAVVAAGLITSLTATVSTNTRFGVALAAQGATGTVPVRLGYP